MTDLSIVAIIPLYNGSRLIEGAIRSVLAQTLQPDEFIVVDDGSTDDGAGAAIVERLAKEHPTITLLRKPNGGQSSARNHGVRHSKSNLIALLDQDDEWYPTHLEKLIAPFRKQGSGLGWVYSNLDVVTEAGDMFCRDFLNEVRAEQPKRHLVRCLSEDMHILPSAALISREAFEAVAGFDERLAGYEDDDLFLRLFCARWENIYLPESLSFWRMNRMSCSYSPRMAKSRMIYARKVLEKFPDDLIRHVNLSRDVIAPKFFKLSAVDFLNAVRDKDRKVGSRALADMAEIAPHMRPKIRMLFAAGFPLLRSWSVVRAAYKARGLLQPIVKRILAI
jgi:glycosyltransferase involved in cell wall biosynthesis